jgi:hypothetical protein
VLRNLIPGTPCLNACGPTAGGKADASPPIHRAARLGDPARPTALCHDRGREHFRRVMGTQAVLESHRHLNRCPSPTTIRLPQPCQPSPDGSRPAPHSLQQPHDTALSIGMTSRLKRCPRVPRCGLQADVGPSNGCSSAPQGSVRQSDGPPLKH